MFMPVVVPWSVEVSSDLRSLLDDDLRGGELRRAGIRSATGAVQELLFRELGVPLPACRLSVSEELPERSVVLSLHEVPAKVIEIPPGIGEGDVAELVLGELLTVLRPRAADFLGLDGDQCSRIDWRRSRRPACVR
jgi:type III secretory pathway component EscV